MALVNRDKDVSEQKDVIVARLGAVGTSVTRIVHVAPYPQTVLTVNPLITGVSGAPIHSFERLSGGSSGLAMGISGYVCQAFSTSGAIAFSGLAASGSTLLNLQKGDMVQVISSGGTGAAVADSAFEIVLLKTQDILSFP